MREAPPGLRRGCSGNLPLRVGAEPQRQRRRLDELADGDDAGQLFVLGEMLPAAGSDGAASAGPKPTAWSASASSRPHHQPASSAMFRSQSSVGCSAPFTRHCSCAAASSSARWPKASLPARSRSTPTSSPTGTLRFTACLPGRSVKPGSGHVGGPTRRRAHGIPASALTSGDRLRGPMVPARRLPRRGREPSGSGQHGTADRHVSLPEPHAPIRRPLRTRVLVEPELGGPGSNLTVAPPGYRPRRRPSR